MKQKNILITGGSGFIGSALAKTLVAKGYLVTVLDNLSEQVHGKNPAKNSYLHQQVKGIVKFIKGSVTSRQSWKKALSGQDIVIHLAAETGTGQSMYQIARYTDVNIGGTAILLDLLANRPHQVKKVIVASSRAIYGEGKYHTADGKAVYPEPRQPAQMSKGDFQVYHEGDTRPLTPQPTDETSKIHPISLYGISKQTQESMIMTLCPGLGIAPVAFRYQNVYGPGQSLSNPYTGILSIFSNLLKNNQTIQIFEDGHESRDFVYIEDVVQATLLGVEQDKAQGGIFNVGTGVPISVLDVARQLMQHYDIETTLNITGQYRIGDIRHNYADIRQIAALGYKPVYDFSSGIRKFTQWVNSQQITNNQFEQSLAEMKNKGLLK